MASCCSCWFPVYFLVSVTLGVIAISSAVHSNSKNSSAQELVPPITHDLSMNASSALRKAGFIVMADLLHRSPLFFRPPQNSTIFAIKDSAIRNTTLPPWLLKNLLLFHTSPSKSSMQDLLNMPQGSCVPTLFRQKNVAVTKVDPKQRSVEINHVLISNPDVYLGDQLAVHGVLAPFTSLRPQDPQWGLDVIPSANCRLPILMNSSISHDKNMIEWNRIVNFLGSKGYASFSVALMHAILDDSVLLGSATIFAPPDWALLGYPSTMLDRGVRLHILPQRFSYRELSSLPVRTLLKTMMVPDAYLEIDGVLGFLQGVVISGVEIVAPEMFASERFVVHGISRAFRIAEFTE